MQGLRELLAKPVDRKQFLIHIGVALLAITGGPWLLKTLRELGIEQPPRGYGAIPYGGYPASSSLLANRSPRVMTSAARARPKQRLIQ